jgi:hypothetical protein
LIHFRFLQSALEPFRNLMESLQKVGSTVTTFDLLVTPTKGAEGTADTITFEISRPNVYAYVIIEEGIEVLDGHAESVLLSSSYLQNLPLNMMPSQPIELQVRDRVYVTYPDSPAMKDTKFDFEYAENANEFVRRTAVQAQLGLTPEALKSLNGLLEAASQYTFKKKLDDPMSQIHFKATAANQIEIEATTGQEVFFADTTIEGFVNYSQAELSVMASPNIWQAGLHLGRLQRQDLFIGWDEVSISYSSGKAAIIHARVSFQEFPPVGATIKNWVAEGTHASFNASINPKALFDRLKYLESVGVQSRSQEPRFLLSPSGTDAKIKLQGFASSGSAVISDKATLDIEWTRQDVEVRLPAKLVLQILSTSATYGLTQFFDLEGIPSVFFSDAENKMFILVSTETPA